VRLALLIFLVACHGRHAPDDAPTKAAPRTPRFPALAGAWRASALVPGTGRVMARVSVDDDGGVVATAILPGGPPISRIGRIVSWDGTTLHAISGADDVELAAHAEGDTLEITLPVAGDVIFTRVR
jgi:hypothetical protein